MPVNGFELGHLYAEAVASGAVAPVVGSVALETTIIRTGTYSLKLTPASGATGYWNGRTSTTAADTDYLRFYVRVTSLPATARVLAGVVAATRLMLNPSGTLTLFGTPNSVVSSVALTDTTKWYRIDIKALLAGGAGSLALSIDGVSQGSTDSGGSAIGLRFGADDTVAATYTAYIDDVRYDSTDIRGAGQAVLLLPVSDNANTNWTAGAGGTTNLWSAVDNIPPAGLASASESATSNIESASSTGTANYVANLKTYTNAGIGAADTLNEVYPRLRHGEDIATGTKTGSYELTANPVIASQTFTFGADGGAHAADGNSVLWLTHGGTSTRAPAVTLGSSPTMKVIKTDTTTRVGCVDFMGMYVDYTPAAPHSLVVDTRRVTRNVLLRM